MATLPLVDLAQAENRPREFAEGLREVMREVGFCYLVGHGAEDRLDGEDGLFALARRLFALPDKEKDAVRMARSPHFRGYTRLGGELTGGRIDWREQIDIGPDLDPIPGAVGSWHLQGPNQWPAALPELRPAVLRHCAHLDRIGRRLLAALASSFGADEDHFDRAFHPEPGPADPDGYRPGPATLLKIVRYPGGSRTGPGGERGQGVGAHKDSGVLTLLASAPGSVGLQVDVPGRGWTDAPTVPGALIVNIGELLQVATGGYLRATSHRVLSPPEGEERVSIPFFYNPALGSTLPALELPAELAARIRPAPPEPDNPIFLTYGQNAWKSRMRAHPDVAERWHKDAPGATREAAAEA
ncbi:MAG: isopenicillin N synthase family dioxygenase [Segniliparus sp.]|uniref:isopenicillin N synthase family dioxygenase n=1 Tax=Segniliparus sp. TaxID=2804064 RepID=UPI003F2E0E61